MDMDKYSASILMEYVSVCVGWRQVGCNDSACCFVCLNSGVSLSNSC